MPTIKLTEKMLATMQMQHDWHGDVAGSICTRCGLRWIDDDDDPHGGGYLGSDGTHYHARDEPMCKEE